MLIAIIFQLGNQKEKSGAKFDESCLKQDKLTFIYTKVVNIYIVDEINLWSNTHGSDFTLWNSLFGAVKLTINSDPDKYKNSDYDIKFGAQGSFLLSDGNGFGKTAVIFGANMSSSVHIDNKKNDVLILCKGPTDGLDNTTLTAKKDYSINFTEQRKKFCLVCATMSWIVTYFLMVVKLINSKQKIQK